MEYLGIVLGLVAIAIIQLAACGGSVLLFLRSIPLQRQVADLQSAIDALKAAPSERTAAVSRLEDELKALTREVAKMETAANAERGRYGAVIKRLQQLEVSEDPPDESEGLDLLSQLQQAPPASEPPLNHRRPSFGKSAI